MWTAASRARTVQTIDREYRIARAMKGKRAAKGAGKSITPDQLIEGLPEPRRSDIARMHRLIRKTLPALAPFVHGGMLGYGPYHYRYPSGREGDWFRVGLASHKSYISLYACAADKKGYVAERYRNRLPGADIGKSCVRFKRVEDLDLEAVRALLEETAATGFGI
jgi:hypothetical protein